MSDLSKLDCSVRNPSTIVTPWDRTDPIAFLDATPDDRRQWLCAIGLGRYAPFLAHLAKTPHNLTCVARFLRDPDRVKFPDLRGADLANLDLTDANLIRVQLNQANLRGAILHNADLIFANFSHADLTGADLRGATLNQTIWTATIVQRCDLRSAKGLTVSLSQALAAGGAIVD